MKYEFIESEVEAMQYDKMKPEEFIAYVKSFGGRARFDGRTMWIYTPGGEWIITDTDYAVRRDEVYFEIISKYAFERLYRVKP
jgi:hypothetical protein